jgi:membrane protease subunit (stomatin/prohibitin family)
MAWFSKETKSLYIARPPHAAKDLIFLHPDKTIPRGANLTVRSDECALFFREGRLVGRLGPGTHNVDTANIPFLGHLLVDKLTDGNHFITELFFVALSECIIDLPVTDLGQYQDQNSRNVVAIRARGSFTVRVKDPERLIVDIGGQSAGSAAKVIEILCGRLANGMRRAVGKRSGQVPILSIVSNADAEAVSTELITGSQPEFEGMGISIQRIINLDFKLDDESLKLLREFGKQESGIALQSKGAQVASQAGFAEYNLVQGQRAALEGMGKGFSAGKTTMFMGGGGLGADLTRSPTGLHRPAPVPAPAPYRADGGPALSAPRQYFIVADGRESGPYSARQIALLVVSNRKSPAEVHVRAEGDPPDCTIPVEMEPAIMTEYKRRAPAGGPTPTAAPFGQPFAAPPPSFAAAQSFAAPSPPTPAVAPLPTNPAFDMAFSAVAGTGTLTRDQISMLAQLAKSVGLAGSDEQAQGVVQAKMQERGVRPV